ncbi:MAG TPA: hypothetical protein VN673_09780 [Clostridia bacterium]|nr:hypothetical protein [Clostridia bacterium]
MRILLRHTESGLFLIGPDKWTADPQRAFDFKFIDRAVAYTETWGLKEVDLAFAFDDPPAVTSVSIERTAARYSAA